jgi:two-component system NtrC family response regulator
VTRPSRPPTCRCTWRPQSETKGEPGGFAERVLAFEKALIFEALDKAGGVQTRAAAALGMSERHLRYKLKKFDA